MTVESVEAAMKKFLVLTYGFEPPTEQVQQAWGAWFSAVAPALADPGSPVSRGVEMTKTDRTGLTLASPSPLSGYCILNAETLEEAEALVASMPVVESVRIYETHSM